MFNTQAPYLMSPRITLSFIDNGLTLLASNMLKVRKMKTLGG